MLLWHLRIMTDEFSEKIFRCSEELQLGQMYSKKKVGSKSCIGSSVFMNWIELYLKVCKSKIQLYSWSESNCICCIQSPSTSSPNYTKYGSTTLNWGIPSTSKWVHNRYIGLMCDSEYIRNTQNTDEILRTPTKYAGVLVQKSQNKEVLQPRRFVAAAAELARSASLLPPLSLPT